MAKGQLTKASINNRGYNKYLKMEGEVTISIDMDKFNADAAWDGIKAYLTNTDLSKEDVIANYGNLWYIERAFWMNKSDLREAIQTSPNTIAKMGKNEPVSLDVLMRICKTLQCDIGDIMEVVEEKTELPMADQAT